jgi:hypothetical protein
MAIIYPLSSRRAMLSEKPQGRKSDFHQLWRAEGPWGQTPEGGGLCQPAVVVLQQLWSGLGVDSGVPHPD